MPYSQAVEYGWALRRPLLDMPLSMQGLGNIAAYTIWADEADDEAMQDWVTSHFRRLEAVSHGSYLADAALDHRSSKFMADANFAKLQRLRDVYDPDRRFFDFYQRSGCSANEFEPR